MGAFDDLIPVDANKDNPFSDLIPQDGSMSVEDMKPEGPFSIGAPRQPSVGEESTVFGGPPRPVASLAETLQEPLGVAREHVEEPFRSRIELPRIPTVAESPVTGVEKAILGVSPIARNLSDMFGPNVPATVLRQGINAAASVPEFLTSPAGVASIPAAVVAPTATAAFFTLDMAKSLGNQGLELWNKWDQMNPDQRAGALTDMGATGAMMLTAGAHLKNRVRSIADAGNPPVIPEEQKAPTDPTVEAEPKVPPTPATEIAAVEEGVSAPPAQAAISDTTPKVTETQMGAEPAMPPGPGARTPSEPPYAPIQQLTDQLNAAPPVGPKEKLAWREKAADAWAHGKSALESAFAKTQAIGTSLREMQRGVRKVEDLDREIGSLDYLLQRSSGQSRANGKAIERAVPNKAMREAIAIWIDSHGDVDAIRNTLAQLPENIRPNVRRAVEQAADLPAEARQIAEQFKQYFGIREQDAAQADIFERGLEDYFTHIWEKPENMPSKLRSAVSNGRVNDYFQFSRERKIPTFLEGIAEGLNPILDPAKVMPYYNFALDRAIASRQFIKNLSDLTAPDGRPAVLPSGTAVPIERGGTPEGMIINPRGKGELGKDYRVIDHPAMRKWKWMGTDENGNPIMYRSDLAVNPKMYDRLARMLDRGRMTPTEWGRKALRVSSEVKAVKLAAFPSFFHQAHVGSHALWHWTNPFKTEEINWDSPQTKFAIEKGHLKLAPDPAELANFSEGVMGPGLIHKIPMLGPISRAYSEYLFGDWIPRLKIKTFENAYQRNLKHYVKDIEQGKITTDEIASRVGDSVNNAYGELNHWFLGKYGRDPRFQRLLRAIFLAPDFGEARLRFTEKAFTKYGHEERLAFATMFTMMYLGARIGNMITHGDPEWDPEKMFSVKAGKRWYSMRSVAGDLLHAASNAGQFMYVRLNPLYSRTISDFLFQRDPQGRKLSWEDMLVKRPLEQLIPINFSNLTRDDQTLWESFITSMGAQARHDVPAYDMAKLVRSYMKDSRDPKLRAAYERGEQEIFAPSDYRQIRIALKNGDLDEAHSEYRKLLTEKGKKPKDIQDALSPKTAGGQPKPYGGLSQAEWQRFKRTLSKSDLVTLKDADTERQLVYDNFVRMQSGRR